MRWLPLLLPLALAACGGTHADDGDSSGVTSDQARQLDAAAAATDINATASAGGNTQ